MTKPLTLGRLVFHEPTNGGLLKWWYPQIIHLNGIFHYKPSILGDPPFMETPKSGLTNAIQLVMPRFESVKTASAKVLWRIRIWLAKAYYGVSTNNHWHWTNAGTSPTKMESVHVNGQKWGELRSLQTTWMTRSASKMARCALSFACKQLTLSKAFKPGRVANTTENRYALKLTKRYQKWVPQKPKTSVVFSLTWNATRILTSSWQLVDRRFSLDVRSLLCSFSLGKVLLGGYDLELRCQTPQKRPVKSHCQT